MDKFRRKISLGSEHLLWKGGVAKGAKGYILIYQPSHSRAVRQYVKRANLVMEKMIGRFLKPKEIVHHKGIHFPINSIENRQDDSPENLQLFINDGEHRKFHFAKIRNKNK